MARGAVRCALASALACAVLLVPAAPSLARPHAAYRVPADNPFVATPGAAPEVYVRGMRNPYRWSFDTPTGDMYIADVGGDQHEEITRLGPDQIAGANLGWHCREGTFVQKPCKPANYFPPTFEYASSPDVVIGGHVVHAPGLPSFAGRYLFGRYLTGLWSLGPRAAGPAQRLTPLTTVTGIGEDAVGNLYATTYDGPVYSLGEQAGALTLTLLGSFHRPVDVVSPPGDASRLFIVEKRGTVQLLRDGVVTTFLDIRDRVRDGGYEEGLLGFTTARDYASSGRVFAFYSDNGGDIQVDEYRRTSRDPDRASPSTRKSILSIQHDQGSHHHGGQMNFGADGYLYLSTGDGDLKVDPQNDAQRLDSLLGKILRIDVRPHSPDRRAPTLRVSAATRQHLLRGKAALAQASCGERCFLAAEGRVRVGRRWLPLKAAGAAARAGRKVRLRLAADARCRRLLEGALGRGRPVSARLTVRAQDPSGNVRSVTVTVAVRR